MKRYFFLIVTILLCAAAIADPVADLQAGKNIALRNIGGTFKYKDGTTTYSNALSAGQACLGTKASGTLNTTFDFMALLSQFNATGTFSLTGSNLGNGVVRWTVSAPAEIGKTLNLTINGGVKAFTVSGVSGAIAGTASRNLQPMSFSFDGTYRDTNFLQTASADSIVLTGKVAGASASLTITPIVNGYGGNAVTQFVNNIQGTAVANATTMGTVTLNQAAPQGGQVVKLVAGGPIVVPSQITVPSGATTAQFSIKAGWTVAVIDLFVIATTNGFSMTHVVAIDTIFQAFAFTNYNPLGGQTDQGIVQLINPAPPGGITVYLHCDDENAKIPYSLTIPQGQTTTNFKLQLPPSAGTQHPVGVYLIYQNLVFNEVLQVQ